MVEGLHAFLERSGSVTWGPGAVNDEESRNGYLVQLRDKGNKSRKYFGCDHTSTNAPDPIRTPQLSVLGRE